MVSYIGTSDAARKLGIDLSYLYRLLWMGKLQGKKVDGKWQVSVAAIEQRLRNGRKKQ